MRIAESAGRLASGVSSLAKREFFSILLVSRVKDSLHLSSVRAEPVEARTPRDFALRQAQGERKLFSELLTQDTRCRASISRRAFPIARQHPPASSSQITSLTLTPTHSLEGEGATSGSLGPLRLSKGGEWRGQGASERLQSGS